MERAEDRTRARGVIHLDVVADRVRRPDADDALRLQLLLRADIVEHLERVVVELLRLLSDGLVVEDLRVAAVRVLAAQLPDLEEGVPVNVREELLEVDVEEGLGTEHVGLRHVRGLPVGVEHRRTRLLERKELARGERGVVVLTQLLVLLADVLLELVALLVVEERLAHRDRTRRVEDVHREAVGHVGRDTDGRVHLRRRRSADKERDLEADALHLLCDGDHLVQRRRDEARAAKDVRLVVDARLHDVGAVAHDANVDDRVVVAAEHDADDVLANVVDVALDGRHHDDALTLLLLLRQALRLARRRLRRLLLLHEGQQVRDRLLHHARRLDHLRQEHLARAEEVADDVHARHKRALDDLQVRLEHLARLLRVLVDELGDALHESVSEPLGDRLLAPLELVGAAGRGRAALVLLLLLLLRELEEALDVLAVGGVVEHDLLDVVAHRLRDVLVDRHGAGVDNAHRHAILDRVVEEDGVDRLAERGQATEAEGEVGHAAGDLRAR